MTCVSSIGIALPRYRVTRETVASVTKGRVGRFEERTIPGPDDDVVTLGTAAIDTIVEPTNEPIETVVTVSTSLPGQSVGAEFCRTFAPLAGTTHLDCFGSSRAVIDALSVVSTDDWDGPCVVVGTDVMRFAEDGITGELRGAGAGALLLGGDGAVRVDGVGTATSTFEEYTIDDKGRWTSVADDKFARTQYAAITSEALEDLDAALSYRPTDVDHAVVHRPTGKGTSALETALGLDEADVETASVLPRYGNLGAASLFVGLHDRVAAAEPGDRVLLVGTGFGGAACATLTVTGTDVSRGVAGNDGRHIDAGQFLAYTETR